MCVYVRACETERKQQRQKEGEREGERDRESTVEGREGRGLRVSLHLVGGLGRKKFTQVPSQNFSGRTKDYFVMCQLLMEKNAALLD